MIAYVRNILTGQLEAALCMMDDCIKKCPPQHWDGKIAKYPFWQVAYHTLCFADLYLSPDKESFPMRDIHPKGWSEFDDEYPSRRFEEAELADYVGVCRQKAIDTLASETQQTLASPSGFRWLPFTRGELHIYNIRHIQHHTGQLSAYLRRIDETIQAPQALHWARTGWQ